LAEERHSISTKELKSPAEQQQLRALGEAMAQQALEPDWKKPAAKKRIARCDLPITLKTPFREDCLLQTDPSQ
jgi:hypothetical protein